MGTTSKGALPLLGFKAFAVVSYKTHIRVDAIFSRSCEKASLYI